ncbi:hypothetical protein EOM86_09735 [Candidatus Nomurabacteria bacterium]|nr:hypothetical protein [Candidatus Nomurabacteria bacterium]
MTRLMMILFSSSIVDTTNLLISQGILSTATANTVTTITYFIMASPAIMLIAIVIWALSSSINRKEGEQ